MSINKVLIVINRAGEGHRSVAEAIGCALDEISCSEVKHDLLDLSKITSFPIIGSVSNLYGRATRNFIWIYDLVWHLTNHPKRIDRLMQFVYPALKVRINSALRQYEPELILVANPFISRLVVAALQDQGFQIPVLVVVSDLIGIHHAWTDTRVDLTFAPTSVGCQDIIRHGIPPEKVFETGFPVHPRFLAYKKSMPEARHELGINPELLTILVTGGGEGSGSIEKYVRLLSASFPDCQLLIVTGSNQRAFQRLIDNPPTRKMRVFGHVSNMEDLIAASDLILSKAGPSTMMECLSLGRPLLITRAVGAQEHGNISYMLQYPGVRTEKKEGGLVQAIKNLERDRGQFSVEPIQFKGAYQIAEILRDWDCHSRKKLKPL